jgi:hypothetical protein
MGTIPNLKEQTYSQDKLATLMGRSYADKEYKNIVFIGYGNIEECPTFKTLLINYLHSHSIFTVDFSNSLQLQKVEFMR